MAARPGCEVDATPRVQKNRFMRNPGAPGLRVLALALAGLIAAGPAAADLWRWIDAEGVARYTPDPDRVPAAERGSLVRVEAGMADAPERAPVAAKPPAIFAPPGDAEIAVDPFNAPERAREFQGEVVVEMPAEAPAPKPPAPPASSPAAEPLPTVDAPAAPVAPAAAPSPAAPVADAASPPAPAGAPIPPEADARRAELVAAIARDEEALEAHVSSVAGGPLAASAELREIAERLPALQAELRALEAQTAAP